ncbi:MAG: NAD(P)/FAD-dependent oxidoreductase [Nanoarchaeota archaeon]
MHDVIIIGAGPAGLYTAKLCKEAGVKILVLEEHDKIGEPDHCSGLISTNLRDFIEIKSSWLDHEVKRAIIYSGSGKSVELKKPSTAAYVINRAKFDKHLAEGLEDAIMLNTHVTGIEVNKDFVEVKTNRENYKSKMIIGSDGRNSVVAKHFGTKPAELIKGIIAITKEKNSEDSVKLWFDKKNAEDGFLWKIPRKETTEYGMMASSADFDKLEKFFKINSSYDKKGALIPIGPAKTFFERALLIGDSAGHVKPWSGGGVVYGFTCAKIAISVIKEALKKNDFSEKALKRYENEWKEAIGKNITAGLMFREFYKDASEKDIESFFEFVQKLGDVNSLNMDFPMLSAIEF